MKKLIALYYLHKCKKANPQWRMLLTKSKSSNSYYVVRKKNGATKDKVRISDHPRLNSNKNPITHPSNYTQKRIFGCYIDERIGVL